jgi:hypothetical protein
MLISLKKRTILGGFPFRKHTAHASSKFIFEYTVYFPSFIDTQYISISFCSTDGHTFSGAIIFVKFYAFQAFFEEKLGKGLIHDVTMLSSKE